MRVLDEGRDFDRGERWGVYNIQRLYLEFLEALKLREDTVPGDPARAELVFYQLGKFSQAISDFEAIYFNTDPAQKYKSFADWLEHQAPDYYADADADVGYAAPDAVVISTVHQAKGMQWPVGVRAVPPQQPVSREAARRARSLPRHPGHRGREPRSLPRDRRGRDTPVLRRGDPGPEVPVRVLLPGAGQSAVRQTVAVLRPLRSAALVPDSRAGAPAPTLEPHAKQETAQRHALVLRAEVPLRVPVPVQAALPLRLQPAAPRGARLRQGAARRAWPKRTSGRSTATSSGRARPRTSSIDTSTLRTPIPRCKATLRAAAIKSVERYLTEHAADLERTVHSEKQIQVHVAPGITVDGRIDLVRRLDSDEVAIVDFKSTARAQDEDVTRDQLHVYAVGYQELTGERADLIEVLNLDEQGKTIRELVEDPLLTAVRGRIKAAGDALRDNDLPRLPVWEEKCSKCDLAELCRDVPAEDRRARRAASGR